IVGAVIALFDFSAVDGLFGIMLVAVPMADVAEEIVEPSLCGISRPIRRRGAAHIIAGQTPLSNRGGGVTGLSQNGCQRMIVRQRLVELLIADVGVALRSEEHTSELQSR